MAEYIKCNAEHPTFGTHCHRQRGHRGKHESGVPGDNGVKWSTGKPTPKAETFTRAQFDAAVAAEREACLEVCGSVARFYSGAHLNANTICGDIARAIRARGGKAGA